MGGLQRARSGQSHALKGTDRLALSSHMPVPLAHSRAEIQCENGLCVTEEPDRSVLPSAEMLPRRNVFPTRVRTAKLAETAKQAQ